MRVARANIPGVLYHLIWRFVDERWFIRDNSDRSTYLRLLGSALTDSDWLCVAYAIMSNHLHLAMIAGRSEMHEWASRVNPAFAQWINRRHRRIGGVIADRAKDYAILPCNEARVIAYIHNNPVRAHVVDRARDTSWTSHRAYLGLDATPAWLAVERSLVRTGFADEGKFDTWVSRAQSDWSEVDVSRVRRAAARRGALNTATPLAADKPVVPLVARPFAHVRPDPQRVVEIVADQLGVSVQQLAASGKRSTLVTGRELAVRAGVGVGLNFSDVAAALGVSRQAVAQIVRRAPRVADEEVAIVLRRIELEGTR